MLQFAVIILSVLFFAAGVAILLLGVKNRKKEMPVLAGTAELDKVKGDVEAGSKAIDALRVENAFLKKEMENIRSSQAKESDGNKRAIEETIKKINSEPARQAKENDFRELSEIRKELGELRAHLLKRSRILANREKEIQIALNAEIQARKNAEEVVAGLRDEIGSLENERDEKSIISERLRGSASMMLEELEALKKLTEENKQTARNIVDQVRKDKGKFSLESLDEKD